MSKFLNIHSSEVNVKLVSSGSVSFLFLIPYTCVNVISEVWLERPQELHNVFHMMLNAVDKPVIHLTAILGDPHVLDVIKGRKIKPPVQSKK